MSLFRGLIVLHIILAVELEPVQSVKLQAFQLTNQSCDSQCEYCRMAAVSRTGNGGKEFQVVPILEKHWGGTRRNKAIPKLEDDRYITKDLMCKFLSFKEKVENKDPDVDLKVVSGFRSVATQKRLFFTFGCQDTGGKVICASGPYHVQPGKSEHGDGIAVDIKTGCKRCKRNCDQDSHPGCESKIMKAVRDVAQSDFEMPLSGSPGHLRLTNQLPKPQIRIFPRPPPAGLPEEVDAADFVYWSRNAFKCCEKSTGDEEPKLVDMEHVMERERSWYRCVDPNGCGCLFGDHWHSYHRYRGPSPFGKCRVTLAKVAKELRTNPETANTRIQESVTKTKMRANVASDVRRIGANTVKCCKKEDDTEPPRLQDMRVQLPKDKSCSWPMGAEGCGCMFGGGWHSYDDDSYDDKTCVVEPADKQWLLG